MPKHRPPKPKPDAEFHGDHASDCSDGRGSLAHGLRRARLKAAFDGCKRVGGDPVLTALAQKGWVFRAKSRGVIDPDSKTNLIARRATPLGCLRIARRRSASAASASSAAGAAGTSVRRAPFIVRDLSAPLAAIAPNLAAAAMIFLFLIILL